MEYKTVGNLKIPQNLSPEKQAIVDEIARNYAAKNREIEADNLKNMGRIALGSLVSGASFHPILNIPYVGTGLGGAMYDAGQGIVAGEKAKDLAKRAGRGFAIGETVGAVPYVGKFAGKTKAGQAVGKQLSKVAEKAVENPAVQKAYDVLMTDIKAFNPNKQTVYHGSPYDFDKFSNEAIGTGEGAQAHGYGHYAAKSKDIADKRYREKLGGDWKDRKVFLNNKLIEDDNLSYDLTKIKQFQGETVTGSLKHAIKAKQERLDRYTEALKNETNEEQKEIYNGAINQLKNEIIDDTNKLDFYNSLNPNDIDIKQSEGQLYKLSVPKDDVMLREDLPFSQQPKAVRDALKDIIQNQRQQAIENLNLPIDIKENAINEFNTAMNYNSNNPMDVFHSWQRLQELIGKENAGKLQKASLKDSLYTSDADIKGRTFYNNLGKSANDILSQNGIKGISYNGGIDGEARVIFNPDDIDIVRKYYNQPTLKDIYNKFINSGTYASALTNP